MTTEKIIFRIFTMPCCGHQLCWVNPRIPSYCPECGKFILPKLKFDGDTFTILRDEEASLNYHS